jgi:hypothetical protein
MCYMCYRRHAVDAYLLVINGKSLKLFTAAWSAFNSVLYLHIDISLHNPLACVVSLTVFCIYAPTGRLLLLATGSLLVMIDLDTEGRPVPQHGLFRAFRSATSLGKCHV